MAGVRQLVYLASVPHRITRSIILRWNFWAVLYSFLFIVIILKRRGSWKTLSFIFGSYEGLIVMNTWNVWTALRSIEFIKYMTYFLDMANPSFSPPLSLSLLHVLCHYLFLTDLYFLMLFLTCQPVVNKALEMFRYSNIIILTAIILPISGN